MKSNSRVDNATKNTPVKQSLHTLEIKMTASQFAELEVWAKECRATPEELTVAFTMDALRMKDEDNCSFEDDIATTIYSLSTFVDKRLSPKEAAIHA